MNLKIQLLIACLLSTILIPVGCDSTHQLPNGTYVSYIDDGVWVLNCGRDDRQLAPQAGGHFATVSGYYLSHEPGLVVCLIEDPENPRWSQHVLVQHCRSVDVFEDPTELSELLLRKGWPSLGEMKFVELK